MDTDGVNVRSDGDTVAAQGKYLYQNTAAFLLLSVLTPSVFVRHKDRKLESSNMRLFSCHQHIISLFSHHELTQFLF